MPIVTPAYSLERRPIASHQRGREALRQRWEVSAARRMCFSGGCVGNAPRRSDALDL